MDEATQQNSALVEAATVKTLEQQANAIASDKRVASFKLREEDLPPVAIEPVQPARRAPRRVAT